MGDGNNNQNGNFETGHLLSAPTALRATLNAPGILRHPITALGTGLSQTPIVGGIAAKLPGPIGTAVTEAANAVPKGFFGKALSLAGHAVNVVGATVEGFAIGEIFDEARLTAGVDFNWGNLIPGGDPFIEIRDDSPLKAMGATDEEARSFYWGHIIPFNNSEESVVAAINERYAGNPDFTPVTSDELIAENSPTGFAKAAGINILERMQLVGATVLNEAGLASDEWLDGVADGVAEDLRDRKDNPDIYMGTGSFATLASWIAPNVTERYRNLEKAGISDTEILANLFSLRSDESAINAFAPVIEQRQNNALAMMGYNPEAISEEEKAAAMNSEDFKMALSIGRASNSLFGGAITSFTNGGLSFEPPAEELDAPELSFELQAVSEVYSSEIYPDAVNVFSQQYDALLGGVYVASSDGVDFALAQENAIAEAANLAAYQAYASLSGFVNTDELDPDFVLNSLVSEVASSAFQRQAIDEFTGGDVNEANKYNVLVDVLASNIGVGQSALDNINVLVAVNSAGDPVLTEAGVGFLQEINSNPLYNQYLIDNGLSGEVSEDEFMRSISILNGSSVQTVNFMNLHSADIVNSVLDGTYQPSPDFMNVVNDNISEARSAIETAIQAGVLPSQNANTFSSEAGEQQLDEAITQNEEILMAEETQMAIFNEAELAFYDVMNAEENADLTVEEKVQTALNTAAYLVKTAVSDYTDDEAFIGNAITQVSSNLLSDYYLGQELLVQEADDRVALAMQTMVAQGLFIEETTDLEAFSAQIDDILMANGTDALAVTAEELLVANTVINEAMIKANADVQANDYLNIAYTAAMTGELSANAEQSTAIKNDIDAQVNGLQTQIESGNEALQTTEVITDTLASNAAPEIPNIFGDSSGADNAEEVQSQGAELNALLERLSGLGEAGDLDFDVGTIHSVLNGEVEIVNQYHLDAVRNVMMGYLGDLSEADMALLSDFREDLIATVRQQNVSAASTGAEETVIETDSGFHDFLQNLVKAKDAGQLDESLFDNLNDVMRGEGEASFPDGNAASALLGLVPGFGENLEQLTAFSALAKAYIDAAENVEEVDLRKKQYQDAMVAYYANEEGMSGSIMSFLVGDSDIAIAVRGFVKSLMDMVAPGMFDMLIGQFVDGPEGASVEQEADAAVENEVVPAVDEGQTPPAPDVVPAATDSAAMPENENAPIPASVDETANVSGEVVAVVSEVAEDASLQEAVEAINYFRNEVDELNEIDGKYLDTQNVMRDGDLTVEYRQAYGANGTGFTDLTTVIESYAGADWKNSTEDDKARTILSTLEDMGIDVQNLDLKNEAITQLINRPNATPITEAELSAAINMGK